MRGKKILIIDDDPIILFMHQGILEDMAPNTQIITLENGALAQDYILGHSEEEFLLLLDINMPVMNGWELLDFLSGCNFHLEVSVLIVTSSVNNSDKVKASLYPMVKGMLIKPLNLNSFTHILKVNEVKNFF
ncbi:response regulator [Pedobacter ginsengiterrae]|uniref:Response regulator n=1 Tax=Pedobacter ginsengiterrae TaxID=871696 RepID=A0ABP7NYF5_9SPHI